MIEKGLIRAKEILDRVEERGYSVKIDEDKAVFRGILKVGDTSINCNTALSLNNIDVPGDTRAEFTTFIYGGRQGENIGHWNGVIDNFNYELPGKLVRDYTDNSNDLIYVTSEPMPKLDDDLIIDNIHHHAQTKARILPHLEHLDKQLGLEPHKLITDSEKFANDYLNTIREMPSTPRIKYLRTPHRISQQIDE